MFMSTDNHQANSKVTPAQQRGQSGDLAKEVRVFDERAEEVDRMDRRSPAPVGRHHSAVLGAVEPHKHPVGARVGKWDLSLQPREDARERSGADLGPAPAAAHRRVRQRLERVRPCRGAAALHR